MKRKIDVDKEYVKWCREIAKANSDAELISHFRSHVSKHFNRHKGEGKEGFLIWLTSVFNFANIFKEKHHINTEDMLLKLCIYLKKRKKGPVPSFNVNKFIKMSKSFTKDYYYPKKRLKK